jgi:hypothetical protein
MTRCQFFQKNGSGIQAVRFLDFQCMYLITVSIWKLKSRTRFGFRIRSYASSDHSIARPSESRKKSPRTSLDRFIKKRVMNKIFFMPKQSRLLRKNIRFGFQMVKTKWQLPFESRTNRSSPDHLKAWLTSLDHFTYKGHKKYFIHAKTV